MHRFQSGRYPWMAEKSMYVNHKWCSKSAICQGVWSTSTSQPNGTASLQINLARSQPQTLPSLAVGLRPSRPRHNSKPMLGIACLGNLDQLLQNLRNYNFPFQIPFPGVLGSWLVLDKKANLVPGLHYVRTHLLKNFVSECYSISTNLPFGNSFQYSLAVDVGRLCRMLLGVPPLPRTHEK